MLLDVSDLGPMISGTDQKGQGMMERGTRGFGQGTRAWLVACAVLMAIGCRGRGGGPGKSLRMAAEEYPVTEGAREARPLLRLAACRVMGVGHEWEETVGPDGKGREVVVTGDLDQRRARERVLAEKSKASGTSEAYTALINGEAELIVVTRPPTEAELGHARDRGIEIDAEPVAFDALVFLTHRDTGVSGLLVRQAREVYAGRISNWSEVGGRDGPITAYRRVRGAPSQELMQRLVMKGEAMAELPEDKLVQTLEGPIGSAGLKTGTLTYTRLANARHQVETERVRPVLADSAPPESDAIRARRYPLVSEIFVATKKVSAEMEATGGIRLRRWLLSAAGQKAVEDAGYAAVRGSEP